MKVKEKSLSHIRLFATPWTVAYKASLSMEFSRKEYWSGFPFPSAGYLPDPGIEPGSPALQADALPSGPQTLEGDVGSIPGLGRSLEKEMATHSSILAWEIPWTEEPGRL